MSNKAAFPFFGCKVILGGVLRITHSISTFQGMISWASADTSCMVLAFIVKLEFQ